MRATKPMPANGHDPMPPMTNSTLTSAPVVTALSQNSSGDPTAQTMVFGICGIVIGMVGIAIAILQLKKMRMRARAAASD